MTNKKIIEPTTNPYHKKCRSESSAENIMSSNNENNYIFIDSSYYNKVRAYSEIIGKVVKQEQYWEK